MFFRNLYLYRFPALVELGGREPPLIESAEALERELATQPLRECGPMELSTTGFVSPLGRDSEAFTLACGQCVLFALGQQERLMPAVVVAEEVAYRVAQIFEREGRRPGAKERRRIKDEVISDLLPRAFVRPRRTLAYVDLAEGWLVVDTSSRNVAETVVSKLREALGRFPATPMAPTESPRMLMTGWLIDERLPTGLVLGEDCELRDSAEAGAIVRCRRQDLESEEVREHLKSGKQVYQLGTVFEDRIAFTLGEDLTLRKLKFLDIVMDKLGEESHESIVAELSSTFALMTLELRGVLERLSALFGIGREAALRLDGGDAPKHMRDACRATSAQLDAAAERDPGMGPAVKRVKRQKAETAIRITAELYRMRERARLLLGEKFPERMRELGAVIAAHAKKQGISEIAAAKELASEEDAPDTWPVVILAAAVEMIEPNAARNEPTEGS